MSTYRETRTRTNGLAIAGLVCGIVGLLFLGIVMGSLAIALGVMGLRAASESGGRNVAIAAIVLGVLDIVGFFVALALLDHSGTI